jgi:TonB family protein
MSKRILIILALAITTICKGQTSQTKYYNSEWSLREVTENKAKFSRTITQNADGTTTTAVKNLKKNEIVQSETYKGKEPFGIWKLPSADSFKTLDYNFPLIYSEEKCDDSLQLTIKDYFQNNDSLAYKAPKISSGELTIHQFIGNNIHYPTDARENGIEGTIYLQLTLTATGTANVVVKRGVDILLDKEAVRVLRSLKFSSAPTVNGQTYVFKCFALPIKFKLL